MSQLRVLLFGATDAFDFVQHNHSLQDMKIVKTIQDTATVTLNEADLAGMKTGDFLLTSKRDVICSNGLQWWILYYPAGKTEENFMSLFFVCQYGCVG
uniref:SH3 domain-containing protein n=1 Tax=Panagrellus redivivus TaxID=6233 RepID=A0A7E4V0Y4_PANRE